MNASMMHSAPHSAGTSSLPRAEVALPPSSNIELPVVALAPGGASTASLSSVAGATYPATAPPPAPDETEHPIQGTSDRALRLGLAANICFFIGAIGNLSFSSNALANVSDDFLGDDATYILGFAGFITSGLLELYFDISEFTRQETNMRQRITPNLRSRCYSKEYLVNIGISNLFVIGTVLDFGAFFLWKNGMFDEEHIVLFVASYTWLVASLIILWNGRSHFIDSFMNCGSGEKNDIEIYGRGVIRLDAVGNLLFFLGTAVDVSTRHVSSPDEPLDLETFQFETVTTAFWMLNSICYLWADVLRLHLKSYIKKQHQES